MAETARVLVASDVHGVTVDLRWLLHHETADAMFFLGDGLGDLARAAAAEAEQGRPLRWPVYTVRGNCDVGYEDPLEGLAPLAGVLFFYTHGHLYGAKSGTGRLAETGAARGADVVLYGHTHRYALEAARPGRPALFNPGSLMRDGSYGVIEIEAGQCRFIHRRVPR